MSRTHELILELAARMKEQQGGRLTRRQLLADAKKSPLQGDSPMTVFQAGMHNHEVEEAVWELIDQKRITIADGDLIDHIDAPRKES